MPDLLAYFVVGWLLLGTYVSYRVEPKVTRLALMVFVGILLWPMTAWAGRRRDALRARRTAAEAPTETE